MAETMKPHQRLLQKHRDELIEKLDLKQYGILESLLEKPLDREQYDKVKSNATQKEQNTIFLDFMEQGSEEDFNKFKKAIKGKYDYLYALLDKNETNNEENDDSKDKPEPEEDDVKDKSEPEGEKQEPVPEEEKKEISENGDKEKSALKDAETQSSQEEKGKRVAFEEDDKKPEGSGSTVSLRKDIEELEKQMSKEFSSTRHPKIARNIEEIARNHYCQYNHQKAIGYYKEALKMWREVDGEPKDIMRCLKRLSISYFRNEKYPESLEVDKEMLDIKRSQFDEISPEIALTLSNMAVTCEKMDENKMAVEYHEQSLTIKRKLFGDRPSQKEMDDFVTTTKRIANLLYDLKEFEGAIKYYEAYVKLTKKAHGDDVKNEELADCLSKLGMSYKKMENHDRAIESHKESVIMQAKIYAK